MINENGAESFLTDGGTPKASLKTSQGLIVLSPKKTSYLGTSLEPSGQVMFNPKDPNVWVIKNQSSSTWRVLTPSGNQVAVEPNGMLPVNKGLKINLSNGENVEIV